MNFNPQDGADIGEITEASMLASPELRTLVADFLAAEACGCEYCGSPSFSSPCPHCISELAAGQPRRHPSNCPDRLIGYLKTLTVEERAEKIVSLIASTTPERWGPFDERAF